MNQFLNAYELIKQQHDEIKKKRMQLHADIEQKETLLRHMKDELRILDKQLVQHEEAMEKVI